MLIAHMQQELGQSGRLPCLDSTLRGCLKHPVAKLYFSLRISDVRLICKSKYPALVPDDLTS